MAPAKANGVGVQVEDTKICVVMVGLPARGKSYIAQIGTSLTMIPADICEALSLLPPCWRLSHPSHGISFKPTS